MNKDLIVNIIDDHIDNELNFLFVCDRELAQFIVDYMREEFDIVDEDCALKYENCNEFYVSVSFMDDNLYFYCEKARSKYNEYLLSDLKQCDYYIGLDMTKEEVYDRLLAHKGNWIWLDEYYEEILDMFTDRVMDVKECRGCVRRVLEDFVEEVLV